MVGGRTVLLSIAVLSGLGFDSVLGAVQFRRQDGAGDSFQGAPGGASSSTTSPEEVASPLLSTTATAVSVAATAPGVPDGSNVSEKGVASSGPGLGLQAVSSGGLSGQAVADAATSTGSEYVYPGVFGAGGSLTTDTRAPSRTVEPSKSSIGPSSGTSRGPPPLDTSTSRGPPPRPRPAPATTRPDDGELSSIEFSVDFSTPSSSSSSTPSTPSSNAPSQLTSSTSNPTLVESNSPEQETADPPAMPTPPRGRPPAGGPPARPSSVTITYAVTETVDLGWGSKSTETSGPPGSDSSRGGTYDFGIHNSSPTTFATASRPANETFTYIPSVTVSYCQPSDLTAAPTVWSVVHTSTITWYGNPEDYTPPYAPISIPAPTSSCIVPVEPPRLTISICASTGTDTKYRTCEVTTTTADWNYGVQTSATPTVVFLTTDKNPAVVYSSIKTPQYGVSQGIKTHDNHATPTDDAGSDPSPPPAYNSPGQPQAITDAAQRPKTTPITVGVQPTAVVINDNTIRDNPAQPTQVVIIADETFTIDPTRVVGGGATIDRPSATGGVYLPVPTSTAIAGVPVVVSSSVAIIGGSSFTLGPTPTTAVVSSQTFTIGPSTIAGASQTLALPTYPRPTEVVVAGGDLITAIGTSVVVIQGKTVTYQPDVVTTVIVDDDVLTLGRGGITAHGGQLTMSVAPGETQYALVGGATITRIGASVVVIREATYTLGPGTGTTTTVVGGEEVTIAPTGVEVGGTMTLPFPFGPTTVITPGATPTGGNGARVTGSVADGDEGEEDAAGNVRPRLVGVVWGVGVAVAIGILG